MVFDDVENNSFNEKRCEKQIENTTFMDFKMFGANNTNSG